MTIVARKDSTTVRTCGVIMITRNDTLAGATMREDVCVIGEARYVDGWDFEVRGANVFCFPYQIIRSGGVDQKYPLDPIIMPVENVEDTITEVRKAISASTRGSISFGLKVLS